MGRALVQPSLVRWPVGRGLGCLFRLGSVGRRSVCGEGAFLPFISMRKHFLLDVFSIDFLTMNRLLSSILLLLFGLLFGQSLRAQHLVVGRVADGKDQQAIELATVRLLSLPDSALLAGTQTDSLGRFTLRTSHQGPVVLKASFLSFESAVRALQLGELPAAGRDTLDVGTLRLQGKDIALRSAVALAALARVEQRGDTTQFNAAAFRTAEGSTLEALIKQLPGAEVGSDGSIKINGKTVKELLVNGKDFFKGETKVAMKNLPTSLVSKVKTYDKKSDYAEQTGIDDGEENFVLDIQTKRELNQSLVSNLDVAGGHDLDERALYTNKLFLSRFTDHSRYSFFFSHNNVGDRGFGGVNSAQNGLTTSTMGGMDFSWENGKKKFQAGRLEVGGSAFYSRHDNNTETIVASETFLTQGSRASYANSHTWSTALNQNIRSQLRLKWSPDTLTSLSLRPSYAWSRGNTTSRSRAATFDADPFAAYQGSTTDWVLEHAFQNRNATKVDSFLVNLNERNAHAQRQSHDLTASLELTRRLPGKVGRTLSFDAHTHYSHSENYSYAHADIRTRRKAGTLGESGTHQFSTSPSTAWDYRLSLSYVEPIVGKLLAELRYNYEYKYTDGSRQLSNLSPLLGYAGQYATLGEFAAAHSNYAGLYTLGSGALWHADAATALSTLSSTDLYAALRDAANSQQATYHYNRHEMQLRLRYNTEQLRLTLGLGLHPERTRLSYSRPALGQIDTLRTVLNFAPQLRLRYTFSKTTRLDLFYRGRSSQPSMTQLLNVVDSSDPLHISLGNPGLKPSWTDNVRLTFNSYDTESQRGLMANASFSATRNALSTQLLYDENTGRRYTRPDNISGHWNSSLSLTYNTPLDAPKLLNFSTTTSGTLARSVGYISSRVAVPRQLDFVSLSQLFDTTPLSRNVALTRTLTQQLSLAYRRPTWDFTLQARGTYQHSSASLQAASSLHTWNFAYGFQTNWQLPLGIDFSSDVEMNSRRGFASAELNTNELVWNAQLSRSFLKNKALTVSLKLYDLLDQQDEISRTVTALMRQDQWQSSLNRHIMLHVIYKLNVFAGTKGAKHPDNRKSERPDFERRPYMGGAPLSGHPRGAGAGPRGEDFRH